MIPKNFAPVVCLALFAMTALVGTKTTGGSMVAHQSAASLAAPPIVPPDDDIAVRFSRTRVFAFAASRCSDDTSKCSDPVKYLGTQDKCACFACGYATPQQKTVCTDNADAQDKLLKQAK